MNAREAALDILVRHQTSRRFVDELLEEAAPKDLSDADRSLLTILVFGAVRHRRTLDHLIGHFSNRPPGRVHPTILDVLRMGFHQILFLRRVPDYAVCDEAVTLARRVNARSAGFANAVLRALLRGIARKPAEEGPAARFLPAPDGGGVLFQADVLPRFEDNPVHALGVRESYPDWLVTRWIDAHGLDGAAAICRAGNVSLPLTVRINRLICTGEQARSELAEDGVRSSPGESPFSLVLQGGGDIGRLSSFRRGHFQVQDGTSMRVVRALAPKEGESLLDACAAPGGKTSHMAEEAPGARIVACDVAPDRVELIRETCERLGHQSVRLVCADMDLAPFRQAFDGAVVDAPCSNTGVLARRADARWRIRPRDLRTLPRRQIRLFLAVANLVLPGGRMVYSTCSIEPEENEHVVQAALRERPELRFEDSELTLPSRLAGGGFYAKVSKR
jgi:16S rRNA (cytosine967-C5)-methyltransferase